MNNLVIPLLRAVGDKLIFSTFPICLSSECTIFCFLQYLRFQCLRISCLYNYLHNDLNYNLDKTISFIYTYIQTLCPNNHHYKERQSQ